jgi:hypothetical protein
LRAYLDYYREFWNCLLPAGEHVHEVGDDTAGCYNCQLEEAWQRMSRFESGCWNWYAENVTPFSMGAGIVADMFRSLDLQGAIKAMFLAAVSSVHQCLEYVQAERLHKAREARNNG